MSVVSVELYESLRWHDEQTGLSIDLSRLHPAGADPRAILDRLRGWAADCAAMADLEAGAIANPDEQRMVGHYWLRDPGRAPTAELRQAIERAIADVKRIASNVDAGLLTPERGGQFSRLLVIGIGGSALGPQFVAAALGTAADKMKVHFFDNTDPDGFDLTLDAIGADLAHTLTVVISKSGGTQETRNGMIEAAAAYARAGLSFARHAIAITGAGSALDRHAREQGFLDTLPMWDWVGGRTSELSAVGLLPAALQGIDTEGLIDGAAAMDRHTRRPDPHHNPAAWLAFAWHEAGGGRGDRAMVILPYKDRLALFSRYLQQLVMESIGKTLDLEGRVVHQGLTVYGNKGSTDQHAYVQQLRDGRADFFATFIEVLADRDPGRAEVEVEPGITSGDHLSGFLQGTRTALADAGRPSITITLPRVDAFAVGALIAVYERAVGIYAHHIGINAYHQPGVEAGKRAAQAVIALQVRVVAALRARPGDRMGLDDIAAAAGSDDAVAVFAILRHLAANPSRGVAAAGGGSPSGGRWWWEGPG